ncbi:hypothetical protein [Conservatibacter flavescens]|uniref:RiboL-PSP-HEPN domain-containing protein n=1 Tax=Conservatibacter flavescens TaxID=28161 RepID=A0A2M8S3R3_9PAST|nr:hypothetical protein [Conservatibacter flavescens]PJG85747.1 hypothetical protein CVP05_04175 [Conservatibacter flavescens]
MYFERDRIELPENAVQGNQIDMDWLKTATPEEQYEALYQWFTNQYEDPAESLPYVSQEGGYIPIHGALVDPFDEFWEFGDIVSDEIINNVAQELYDIAGNKWSPVPSIDDFYEIKETALDRFELRIARAFDLLNIKDDFLIKASVFSLLITAFETYLWEITKEYLSNDKLNLESHLINNLEAFEKKMSLADIYFKRIDVKKELYDLLDNKIVWHNIKSLTPILAKGFVIDPLPDFGNIQKHLDKRHNIVHRFGMNIDGYEMPLTKEEIVELKTDLTLFVYELEQKISDRLTSL